MGGGGGWKMRKQLAITVSVDSLTKKENRWGGGGGGGGEKERGKD